MVKNIKLCAIVAMAQNNVIGGANKLLWHIPEDLKHFKRTTMGKPLIMGRKTFESLPGILPGRAHIIVSRSGGGVVKNMQVNSTITPALSNDNSASPQPNKTQPNKTPPDVQYVSSIKIAIDTARELAHGGGQCEIFIAGGGEIYRQTLGDVQRLYLTIVHRDYDGDTVFPDIDWAAWTIVSEDKYAGGAKAPAFTVYVMERK